MQQQKKPRDPGRKAKAKNCPRCGEKYTTHAIKIDSTTRKVRWECK